MKYLKYILISLIIALNVSCTKSDTIAISKGNVTLKLTDAPMPYNQFMEASITIDSIELGNSADANSFIVIMNKTTTYNMLDLINGVTDTMASMAIPEGKYDTLRLFISSTEMVMNDGTSFSYDMNQSGSIGQGGMMGGSMMFNNQNGSVDIKLDHFMDINANSDNNFLMDLDVNQSFMLNGVSFDNNGMGGAMQMHMTGFTFNPTMRFVDMNQAGTILGTVHSDQGDLGDVTITMMLANNDYTTTHTDADGHYKFIGIPKGVYTMQAEADGFTMSTTGNENNMGDIEMMDKSDLTIDFNMTTSN